MGAGMTMKPEIPRQARDDDGGRDDDEARDLSTGSG
jgi:hypothetical protein